MTKNKFAHSPYLPEYDELIAVKLNHILRILSNTCCKFQSPKGARIDLDLLIARPSQIRKCDLHKLKDIIEAINQIQHLF